jgi:hypothetical protein
MGLLLKISIIVSFAFVASAKEQERASLQVDDKMFLGDVVVKKGKLNSDQLEVRGFKIQESSVDAVAKKYKAKVFETGDGDDALYLVCLIGNDKTVLEYTSGEMGGTENTILTVGLYNNSAKYKYKKECTKVDKAFKKQRVGGLKLGMKEKSIINYLGEPSKKNSKFILYYFEDKKKIKGLDFNVNSVIHATMKNGEIASISVSQIMSY